MDRRMFIELTSGAIAFAGCLGSRNDEDVTTTDSASAEEGSSTDELLEDEKDDDREPEGGDGKPYTHYDLDIRDERWDGQPVWIDQDERLYGRDGRDVLISDDWWETTEVITSFDEKVETVIVPDSGQVLVAVGGRGDTGGRIERLDGVHHDVSETLYQFDHGRVSNSMGHAVHEDIIVISCYERSDFDAGDHANEVILSTNGGESFKQVLEVPLNDPDASNLHIHDVEYDPYADRIWVAVGDHGNSQIYWSDDFGESWETIAEQGAVTMLTQVAAFEDCVAFGTDGAPEGIIRWGRDGPDDAPDGVGDLEHHVTIETDPNDDTMEMYARRRWHVREDDGRELCLMPFGYSPMHETASDSVILASVDGDKWYELYRTETRDILLTNIMEPLSMVGERRVLVSDSNKSGYQADARVPEFWD